MTTLTTTLTRVCAGGGHFTFDLSGAKAATVEATQEDLTAPLNAEDARAFIRVIAWMAKNGRTTAAAKTLLQAGVTVVI